MSNVSVFLPFHNEEGNIREAIENVLKALSEMPEIQEYEVIIVNDGSTDKTKEIAEELVREHPRVRLVNHETNEGYGSAVMTGVRTSRYEYIFFTDGDLQFDVREIKKLLQWVPEYSVVIGYREQRNDSQVRLLNAFMWNLFIRIIFGLKVKDIDCAFKLIKRSLVVDLPMISGGAMFSAELLSRLKRSGERFKEVAVTHMPRTRGSSSGSNPRVIIKAFQECFKVYRDLHQA